MNIFREKYNELIEFRKNNPPEEGAYIEHHHIIPKSIAPELEKDPSNIVALTGKEHLKAHYFLALAMKEEGDKNYRKMLYAIRMMKMQIVKNSILTDDELDAIAEIYEKAKKDLHDAGVSEETKQKISESKKGREPWNKGKTGIYSDETLRKIGEKSRGRKHTEDEKHKISDSLKGEKNPNYGKHLNEEQKQKMSESHKNPSENTRRKISDSLKGNEPWNKGKTGIYSDEILEKMSESHKNPSEDTRKKMRQSQRELHWFNNGIEEIKAFECPEGFFPGRIKKAKQ